MEQTNKIKLSKRIENSCTRLLQSIGASNIRIIGQDVGDTMYALDGIHFDRGDRCYGIGHIKKTIYGGDVETAILRKLNSFIAKNIK